MMQKSTSTLPLVVTSTCPLTFCTCNAAPATSPAVGMVALFGPPVVTFPGGKEFTFTDPRKATLTGPAVVTYSGPAELTFWEEIVILKTTDGAHLVVSRLVAEKLGNVIEHLKDCSEKVVVITLDVSQESLMEAVRYRANHMEFTRRGAGEDEIQRFDLEFMRRQSTPNLRLLVQCADSLEMKDLLVLSRDALEQRDEPRGRGGFRFLFGSIFGLAFARCFGFNC